MIYDGREFDDGPALRRTCIELSLQLYRGDVHITHSTVVEAAKAFEAYIKGNEKEQEASS